MLTRSRIRYVYVGEWKCIVLMGPECATRLPTVQSWRARLHDAFGQARTYYAAAIKRFMSSKQMDPYMQKIQFQVSQQATGDPDRPAM